MGPGVDDLTGLLGRRSFEDELDRALGTARSRGGEVAVVVASLMGLPIVHARHGSEAVAQALRVAARRVADAAGPGRCVGRVGEDLFAVLVPGGGDDADDVEAALIQAFAASEVDVGPGTVRMGVATAIGVGPTRPVADDALLWRTVEMAAHRRAARVQAIVDHQVLRGARTLDEVGRRIVDDGLVRFDLRAMALEVDGRVWSGPGDVPGEPPDAEWPLRTAVRDVGVLRAWGVRPDEVDEHAVSLIFAAIANAVDRALVLDASEGRARRDPLTGLLNRDGLQQALAALTKPYALGVVDVDRFKSVNDRFGHDVGDSLLRELAALLARGRATDVVARWGGDEIVMVMPGTTALGAAVRLRRVLDECRSTLEAGGEPLTFSAGITEVEPDGDLLDAVRRADRAMYQAKAAGRARVELAR